MPPSLTFAERAKAKRMRHIAATCFVSALPLAAFFATQSKALGQVPSESSSTQSDGQSASDAGASAASSGDSGDSGGLGDSLSVAGNGLTPAVLSSDQIIGILQDNPDLLAEFKSQLADRLQEQGAQINVDDISDQTLFNQISTSAPLRANITTVLVGRGFVTSDELQTAHSSAADDGSPNYSSSGQSSRSLANGGAQTEIKGSERDGATEASSPVSGSGPDGQNSGRNPRGREKATASTDVPAVVHEPTPFNLQSMHDLYAQIPSDTARLQRFGSDVFVNRALPATARGVSGVDTPLDVPIGPDYVLGSGDKLEIDLWGGVAQAIVLTLDKAQDLIEAALKQQFRDAQVSVTVSGLRTVRVYIVGDVQRPGGYDISSLATPLSALYAAGGPTAVGSLRTLHHYRGEQLVDDVDLYDFLLHGIRNNSARFESGDTLLVPPAGPQVAVSGAVKRQAIYELNSGQATLAEVIADAGGFTAAASLNHIGIERIDASGERVTVTPLGNDGQSPQAEHDVIASFAVKDGDRIRVEPILPYSQRAVYLAGHVVRPGRRAFTDGMRLSDVLHSYQDMLPEPAAHAEVVRLVPPDLHAETIDFNVPDVLIGNTNLDLKPFDTIRIFGRYQVDAPTVTILG